MTKSLQTNHNIVCAKCNRAVDEIVIHQNPATRSVEVEARCHGQRETMATPEIDLIAFGKKARVEGLAFQDTRAIAAWNAAQEDTKP